jgi:MoxR-like ATPase
MGYPVAGAEVAMLDIHAKSNPLDDLEPVTDAGEIMKMVGVVKSVYVSSSVQQYAVALAAATRQTSELRLGASPRATLHLIRAARARAALDSRDFVLPDDVEALVQPVLAHRLLPATEAQISGRSLSQILGDIVRNVPMPQVRAAVET